MAIQIRQPNPLPPEFFNEFSGHHLQNIAIAFIVINTFFAMLRIYARRLTKIVVGWDDYLYLAAYLFNMGLCIGSIAMIYTGGIGRHVAAVAQENPGLLVNMAKGVLAVELIYLTAVALPKLSALCFYLRIFTSRTKRVLTYIAMVFVTMNWAAFILTGILQCRPVAYQWDKEIPGGECIDAQAYSRATCVPGIVTDLIVMALPISSILKLKLPTFKKIALTLIFLTAGIGVIASIIRFAMFFTPDAFADSTWSFVSLMGWTIIESGMYLIAACLPFLRPVFALVFKSMGTTKASTYQDNTHELKTTARSTTDRSGFEKFDSHEGKGHDMEEISQGPSNSDTELAVTRTSLDNVA